MASRHSPYILLQVAHTPASFTGTVRQVANFGIPFRDAYLPCFVSEGEFYIQAPLRDVCKAIAEAISEELRDLEVRISIEGRAPLSLDSVGRQLSRASMGESTMVGDS